ncbi:5-oxoprolinase subunit PxpA [Alteromonas sp. ASW11-36]|uniref:5-oxoprolinase subunit PxpA n=1 Tax=Alteromonas arenosi TaxID=3055817 RepID=A0ABT7SZF4_9ALTE|nr:5-oxoprolinase subunit PxpA [Alteromonas sp. ASW11-36]MDM7860927.1 5-oxoprolinase subunit PxpA [Alteromonas sp. ASW11-36]
MLLNCDLGEDFGAWKMSVEPAIMEVIDQANIACGFHGGDPLAIETAIKNAVDNNVSIGAHPSYPDLVGFGRRHIAMSAPELQACLRYQISALKGLCELHGSNLDYVKPHGALYNDLVKNESIRACVMTVIAEFSSLQLMLQAGPWQEMFIKEAQQFDIELQFEAFIDRRYTDDGYLTSRRVPGAVLTVEEALTQAQQLIQQQKVTTQSGQPLTVMASTLCIHGDNSVALGLAQEVRKLIEKSRV